MKPGSVVSVGSMRAFFTDGNEGPMYTFADGSRAREDVTPADPARTLVVIDPEDREQIGRLVVLLGEHGWLPTAGHGLRDALRKFANPTPTAPTDPTARVTDRRENVWRLLADGDWVCTSGPDHGEYLVWSRLVADRGPLQVEVAA